MSLGHSSRCPIKMIVLHATKTADLYLSRGGKPQEPQEQDALIHMPPGLERCKRNKNAQ